MNKRINLIVGSGVLGAYLSAELLRKKEKVVVTTRSLKKIHTNYNYLKIQKKIKFEKLNINKKNKLAKSSQNIIQKKFFTLPVKALLLKVLNIKKRLLALIIMELKIF